MRENERKKVSAAVLFTDKTKFLAVHPTGELHTMSYWDLPKGQIDDNENPLETAQREFMEEVGLKLDSDKLKYVGKYPLHAKKDIVLYLYIVDELPPLSSFSCKSTTTRAYANKKEVVEVDGYKYFRLSEFTKLRKNLYRAMIDVVIRMRELME